MSGDRSVLERGLERLLSAKDIHVDLGGALEGLDWTLAGARPDAAPHSIFQLVNHMAYWQEWVVKWLDGEEPAVPKHAAGGWPGSEAPTSSTDWEKAVERLRQGLEELRGRCRETAPLAKHGEKSRLEVLQALGPPRDHAIERKVRRLAAVDRGVELLPRDEPPRVVHAHPVRRLGRVTIAGTHGNDP